MNCKIRAKKDYLALIASNNSHTGLKDRLGPKFMVKIK